jgi:hypothetical protein
MVMLANNKDAQEISNALEAFLGENTASFVQWYESTLRNESEQRILKSSIQFLLSQVLIFRLWRAMSAIKIGAEPEACKVQRERESERE